MLHADLKPANVLCKGARNSRGWLCKLADYGNSRCAGDAAVCMGCQHGLLQLRLTGQTFRSSLSSPMLNKADPTRCSNSRSILTLFMGSFGQLILCCSCCPPLDITLDLGYDSGC